MTSALGSNGSTTAWRKIRKTILDRDGHTCAICGAFANHVDHIIPRSQGGTDSLDNLQTLCRYHNLSKGDGTRSLSNSPVFSTPRTPSPPFVVYLSPTERKPADSPFERPDSSR